MRFSAIEGRSMKERPGSVNVTHCNEVDTSSSTNLWAAERACFGIDFTNVDKAVEFCKIGMTTVRLKILQYGMPMASFSATSSRMAAGRIGGGTRTSIKS